MANTTQYDEIRRILTARRRDLMNEIQNGLRDARADASGHRHYRIESGETTEVHPEDDLAFALIHIKAQVLERINEALSRLDEGTYGYCDECADLIAASRLRALPFAVRCKECEEMHEQSGQRGYANRRDEWQRC
jgi:DnaK suppressor protein